MLEVMGGCFIGLFFLILAKEAFFPDKPDPLKDPEDEKNPDGI